MISRERRIVIYLLMWAMTALSPSRIEALMIGDITPVLPPPPILWQDALNEAGHTVLGSGGILRSLVQTGVGDDGFAQRLGFASASEIITGLPPAGVAQPTITLAIPFAVMRVDLKRLQHFYPAGQNPLELLLDETNWFNTLGPAPAPSGSLYSPARLLFPIINGKVSKSSVFLRFSVNSLKWDIQQLGSPHLINRLTTCGTGLTGGTAPVCDGATYFVVWIPSLNRFYLGRIASGIFKLKAVFDEPAYGFMAGDEREAKVVFEALRNREAIHISDNSPPR